MKQIIYFLFSLMIVTSSLKAQNNLGSADDLARIPILAYVPNDIGDLTLTAQEALQMRLERIITKAGIGGARSGERFILTAKIVELDKNISSTTPTIYYYNLEITLLIGDAIEGKIFSSIVFESKGSGGSETKAYINAIKQFKDQDPKYSTFIDQAKTKIIEYYNSKCDFILKEAEMLTNKNDFDGAIASLTSIPEVCKECYDKAMDAVAPIYQKQIDRECKQRLMESTTAWNAAQDLLSAENAGGILSQIEPGASCYKEALFLSSKIAQRVKELDQREWKFQMKQQQDNVDIKKATIKAARDIGVAYGNGPKAKVVKYNIRGWWGN